MPTVVRFLVILAVTAVLVLAAMAALVTFVHVVPRPMEETIAPGRLK